MKAAPLLISWHDDNAPIYSLHFDSHHGHGRLATAGNDNNVRLWKVDSIGQERKVTYLSTLMKHTQAVNVVRFCPKGEMLASAGDDGNVLLWVPSELGAAHSMAMGEDHSDDKEIWRVKHMCRSSGAEIYDLAWSPDGVFFITGSMDNIARIYNAQTGQMVRQIAEHSHYVQGVAWDPLNEFVATQSSDRSVHIYSLKTKDGQFTLSNHAKFLRMDMPPRRPTGSAHPANPQPRPQSPLPTLLDLNTNIPRSSSAVSPVPSTPGTPLPMDPPSLSHRDPHPLNRPVSRRSSFSSQHSYSHSVRRSASPAPSIMPLPAVKPLEPAHSPKIFPKDATTAASNGSSNFGLGAAALGTAGNLVKNANIYANETLTSFFRRLTFSPDGSLLFTPAGQYKTSVVVDKMQQANPLSPAQDLEDQKPVEETVNTVYIYTRAGFNKQPVAHLPGHKKPSIAVCCSPVRYELRRKEGEENAKEFCKTKYMTVDTSAEQVKRGEKSEVSHSTDTTMPPPSTAGSMKDSIMSSAVSSSGHKEFPEPEPSTAAAGGNVSSPSEHFQEQLNPPTPPIFPSPVFSLPYRIVYAVATQDTVLIYDTQQSSPLCVVSNLHFATFTDLTWSPDGLTLLMSSSDGFCSTIAFEKGELGVPTGEKEKMGSTISSAPANSRHASLPPSATVTSAMPPTTIPLPSPSPSSMIVTSTSTAAAPATTSTVSIPGPAPTLTSIPATALGSSSSFPMSLSTPPETPLPITSGPQAVPATSTASQTHLGKRGLDTFKDGNDRSETESAIPLATDTSAEDQGKQLEKEPISSNRGEVDKGESQAKKKRRIAPTLVTAPNDSTS